MGVLVLIANSESKMTKKVFFLIYRDKKVLGQNQMRVYPQLNSN